MKRKTVLSREAILHLAKLANLSLTEEGIKKFQTQLSEILSYISQLDELDTSTTKPTDQVTDLVNITRPDVESDERKLTQEEVLKNASNKKNDYLKVPAIFTE